MHYDDIREQKIKAIVNDVVEPDTQHDDTTKNLKETAGKPEGARFTYLSEFAKFSSCDSDILLVASMLENLSQQVYDDDLKSAYMTLNRLYFTVVISLYDNDINKIISETTAVRYHAIKSGKYKPLGYKEEIKIELLLDAAARHLLKYILGEELDDETEVSHLAHLLANVLMISVQIDERKS